MKRELQEHIVERAPLIQKEVFAAADRLERKNLPPSVWADIDKIGEALAEITEMLQAVIIDGQQSCSAVMYHGPGHQSKARCQRTGPHNFEDEHYAANPMAPGFFWTGEEAFA